MTKHTGHDFDVRDGLAPSRLTIIMWDQAFLFRHIPGGSFEDYDKVLDEAVERGYNTLRLDPMPSTVDLADPDKVLEFTGAPPKYMPWGRNADVRGPVGRWLIEFMDKVNKRGLHYTLSPWWGDTPMKTAELWAKTLHQWQRLFGFDGLVYLDLVNEFPCFMGGFGKMCEEKTGQGWKLLPEQLEFAAAELNAALDHLRGEFPELRYTTSIHGDLRWLAAPLRFDCLDVHFYADADPRWTARSKFYEFMKQGVIFNSDTWFKEFSDRCTKTIRSVGPMLRARQRYVLGRFAQWAADNAMPLTTSESWACWYYYDHPDLDWEWLKEWAAWSVDDAIDFKMWGWTPHNYCQPQFENWKDAGWHRRLTEKFLSS
ncbi:MAG TPA: cellulase-like family protein [Phycisphaerae bacterium]|nr:cellulase-like family protein [Phycisphaerae bacterium]